MSFFVIYIELFLWRHKMSTITGIGNPWPNPGQLNRMTVSMINNKDTDGDKALNAKELDIHEEVFTKIDINKDGKADREELNIYYPVSKVDMPTVQLIETKDADGDKTLNAKELDITEDTLAKIDTNSDGKADREELNTAHPLNKLYNILSYQPHDRKEPTSSIDTMI